MPSHNHKGRTKRPSMYRGPFIALETTMLECAAFRSLTGAEMKTLLHLMAAAIGHDGYASASIRYLEQRTALSKSSIASALSGLCRKGFIERESIGFRYGAVSKGSRYRMNMPTLDGPRSPSRAYLTWKPDGAVKDFPSSSPLDRVSSQPDNMRRKTDGPSSSQPDNIRA